MKYLITLTISLIALYAFVKRTYKYASAQDTVEAPPIDFEETREYKENEIWFSGMGRCWMREFMKISMVILITINIIQIIDTLHFGLDRTISLNIVIIMLCLQIINLNSDLKKLEKEKVTILRINNRSDD